MAITSVETYNNEAFQRELMQISQGIVWKNTSLAKASERVSSMYLAELFMTANRGVLTFDVIKSFPRVILEVCGVVGNDIDTFAADKTKIPESLRQTLVDEYQRALVSKNPITGHPGYLVTKQEKQPFIDEDSGMEFMKTVTIEEYVTVYQETNNYYRMLNGLPDMDDTDFIYNTDKRWTVGVPIHEMTLVERIDMEDNGIIDELLKEHPTKQYLKYVGRKMIDLYTARAAERYDILWMQNASSSKLSDDFRDIYNGCKNQVNMVYYSETMRKTNELYDNFMAMSVLFMTIQTMMYRYLSTDVIRDFYDTDSLKYIYDSYSVPFYQEIPLDYHRKIVKNINRLIGYKGSSKVFFDLFSIFDLAQMDIYSYYITKTHKMGDDGNPLFIIKKDENGKDMYDEHGNPILDPECYNIAFARGRIYDDPSLSVADPGNAVDKTTLTDIDPYWIEDKALIDKLNSESFDFTESKYIGVQTVFDLLKISYENAYIFKMISDNREITDALSFRWGDLGINCTLFELFIYLAALFCKKHGYNGEISSKLPFTSACLGYNFEENITDLRKYISEDPILSKDKDLAKVISSMTITNIASISTLLEKIYELRDFLIQRYTDAHTLEEFETYKALYDTLLTSQIIEGVFKKSNSETATSFVDLLNDISLDLANRYATLSDDQIEGEMMIAIDKLEELISACRYMPFSAGLDSSGMIDSLFKILAFFKSAKAELAGYNVVYRLTMRGISFFKLLDKVISWRQWGIHLDESHFYLDLINYIKELVQLQWDLLEMRKVEYVRGHYTYHIDATIQELQDQLVRVHSYLYPLVDEIYTTDALVSATFTGFLKTIMETRDSVRLTDLVYPSGQFVGQINDHIHALTDELIELFGIVKMNDKFISETIQDEWIQKMKLQYINDGSLATDRFYEGTPVTQLHDIYDMAVSEIRSQFKTLVKTNATMYGKLRIHHLNATGTESLSIEDIFLLARDNTVFAGSKASMSDTIRTSTGEPL